MTDTCALCGGTAQATHRPWMEWTDYLRDERDMDPPIGALIIPVCYPCERTLDVLHHEWDIRNRYPDETTAKVTEDVHAALDHLSLDALEDELM